MSGKISEIRSKGLAEEARKRPRPSVGWEPEDDPQFKKALKEVLDFVNPQLGKQQQRYAENTRIKALGGMVEKQARMPYNMLQERQKKHKEKARQQQEEIRKMGPGAAVNHNPFLSKKKKGKAGKQGKNRKK